MGKRLGTLIMMVVLMSFIFSSTTLGNETLYFDFQGNVIDKPQYDQMVISRDKVISSNLEDGYVLESQKWKDPIRLRKARIEQWRKMRSFYDPNSLPFKIEPGADAKVAM